MTKLSFKPVDIMRETYKPSHYKDLNQTRPALKLKLRNLKLQTIMNPKNRPLSKNPKFLNLYSPMLGLSFLFQARVSKGTITLACVRIWRI